MIRDTCTPTSPSGLSRLDARPKLLATLAFLVSLSLVPWGSWLRLGILAGLLLPLLLWDKTLQSKVFWLRLAPILSLALVMMIFIALTKPGVPQWRLFTLGSFTVSSSLAGVLAGAELGLRTLIAAAALVVLSLRTSGPELLNALAYFRVPGTFLAVLGAVSRTLWIVTDEARRMNRARMMRGSQASFGRQLQAVGGIIASLLGRSFDRAERVHRAMIARGFDGTVPKQLPPPRIPPGHLITSAGFAVLSLTLPMIPL